MKLSPLIIPYLIAGFLVAGLLDNYKQAHCHSALGPVGALVLAVFWPMTLTIGALSTPVNSCKKEARN